MKKLLSLLSCLSVLFLAACSSEEAPVPNPDIKSATSNIRTVEEAVEIAKAFVATDSRSSVEVADVAVIGSSNSRSACDTLIYAINFADNTGYALVSAAKQGIDVIGYTENGAFDAEKAANNSSFTYYLEEAKTYVANTLATEPGDVIIDPSTPIISKSYIFPRVYCDLGQDYPEGNLCPNGLSGCTQTALMMALTYVREPQSIEYTCEDIDIESEEFDWNIICSHRQSVYSDIFNLELSHDQNCPSSELSHPTIARICRELGFRSNATYGKNTTTTSFTKLHQTAVNLLPAGKVSNSITNIQSNVASEVNPYETLFNTIKDNSCVAIMTGADSATRNVYCWVCDGGLSVVKTWKELRWDGTWDSFMEEKLYLHFNWGDCGNDNGYFSLGVFDTTQGMSRAIYDSRQSYFLIKS